MNSFLRTILESVVIAMLFALTLFSMAHAEDRGNGWHTDPFPDERPTPAQELLTGLNAFNWNLYSELSADPGKNLFYSPYSIYEALAMVYTGARGQTAEQMDGVMLLQMSPETLGQTVSALHKTLHPSATGDNPFHLTVANALWGQKSVPFHKTFLDTLEQYYGAGLRLADFKNNAESERKTINDWVQKQTNDRIKDLLAPGDVDSGTRLVLTNAIYFKAAWAEPFQQGLTTKADFHLYNGKTVSVDMMRSVEKYRLYDAGNFRAAVLPYAGGQMSMVLILPDPGKLEAVEQMLVGAGFGNVVPAMALSGEFRKLDLQLPRFRMETNFSLAQTLKHMGMPAAFTNAADFSGMTDTESLKIDGVIHKAFVAVDEKGTEAAAATGIAMRATSAPPPETPVPFICDRPFLLVIQHNHSNTILFTGRVSDPS
jgi:serpin B